MNCLVVEQRDAEGALCRLMIDCGVVFPPVDWVSGANVGIDVFRPSFAYLRTQQAAQFEVVLTHGHEDHIGAVPYLLQALEKDTIVVWGPAYALELAKRRLEEVDNWARELGANQPRRAEVEWRTYTAGEPFAAAGFEIEPIRVAHSIESAHALAVTTGAGTIVHTGDFKLDASLADGGTDGERLAALGDRGVKLLLSDSTNAHVAGFSGEERTVREGLGRVVARAKARVVVGCFASNIHRLRAVGEIATETGRRLCLLGRSVKTHAEVTRALGMLAWKSNLLISPEQASRLARHEVLYVAGGTQGEPRGSLRRLASANHHQAALEAGDTVVLSSRIIPGNERAVYAMIDAFVGMSVHVHSRATDPTLHVSGHAHREEQAQMLAWLRPECFVPVHGGRTQMDHHAETARQLGVAQIEVIENGEALRVDDAGLTRLETVSADRLAMAYGRPLHAEQLRERRQLARSGIVIVAIVVTSGAVAAIEIGARGVVAQDQWEASARAAARAAFEARQHPDPEERIRRAVRRAVAKTTGSRPLVKVSLATIDSSNAD